MVSVRRPAAVSGWWLQSRARPRLLALDPDVHGAMKQVQVRATKTE
jgi:hypothetical protein